MENLNEIYNQIDSEYEVYEPTPRKAEKESKARTYIAMIVEKYEPCFRWDNDKIDVDRGLLYMKSNQIVKKYSDTKLRLLLDWAKPKNLHIKQFIKTLNKALMNNA